MLVTERMLMLWLLNELVKLEQNLSIFNQPRYMTKNCVKVVKKDVSDRENVVIVVVKWVGQIRTKFVHV